MENSTMGGELRMKSWEPEKGTGTVPGDHLDLGY